MGKRIFFQIYPGFLIIIALTIIPTAWFATRIFQEFHIENLRDEVLIRANMMNGRVAAPSGKKEFLQTCEAIAGSAGARVTVIDPGGKGPVRFGGRLCLHAGSFRRASGDEGGSGRPSQRVAIRYSSTLQKDMLYAAEPLLDANGKLIGVLRLSLPVEAVDTNIGKLNFKLGFFAFFLAVFSMLLGLLISRRLSRRLKISVARWS